VGVGPGETRLVAEPVKGAGPGTRAGPAVDDSLIGFEGCCGTAGFLGGVTTGVTVGVDGGSGGEVLGTVVASSAPVGVVSAELPSGTVGGSFVGSASTMEPFAPPEMLTCISGT